MAIHQLEPPPPSPAELICAADELLVTLLEIDAPGLASDELVDGVAAVQTVRARLAAIEATLLAEVHARDVARKVLHWGSTGEWYAHLAGVRRGQGKRVVDRATTLVTSRSASLAALQDGGVSAEQVAVVVDAVDELPGDVGLRDRGEKLMLDHATRLNATDLDCIGRRLDDLLDPDMHIRRAEAALDRAERVAHRDRFLSITDDRAGGICIRGRGSVEDGAIIRAALLPLTAPQPSVDGDSGEQVADRRDHGTRMFDALVLLAQHGLDTQLGPASHGTRPRLVVATQLEDLRGQLGPGFTDTGEELSGATVRRLACDADVVPAVLGGESEILDVGREARLVTTPIWRALVLRDRHCRFPGCSRPPVMCHGHHVQHWADGGSTSLDNLVLLCGLHHRVLHHEPWKVEMGPDGQPVFTAPRRTGLAFDIRDGQRLRGAPRRE